MVAEPTMAELVEAVTKELMSDWAAIEGVPSERELQYAHDKALSILTAVLPRVLEGPRQALDEAEACMSIVEPRSDKAEYLRILGVIRDRLSRIDALLKGE